MASAPFTILTSKPADSDLASQHPADERSFRDIVDSWLKVNHDATTGRHKYVEMNHFATLDPSVTAAVRMIWENSSSINLLTRVGAGTVRKFPEWVGGGATTSMLFAMTAVPTGWQLATGNTDRVLMLTNTASEGGDTGGSWTITGLTAGTLAATLASINLTIDVGTATLTENQIPAHKHEATISDGGELANNGATRRVVSLTNSDTSLTGGGQAHDHTSNTATLNASGTSITVSGAPGFTAGWRPNYIKVFRAAMS